MPRFSDDGRWAWDYASNRWIPANKIGDTEGLKKLGIENIIVEPRTYASELKIGDGNGTNLKLLAMAMAFFLPGIDYSVLGWIKPRKNKQIWLGIGIFFTFSILLGTAILCPLAFLIWLHGIATVAARADERVVELGGYTNDISGNRVVR